MDTNQLISLVNEFVAQPIYDDSIVTQYDSIDFYAAISASPYSHEAELFQKWATTWNYCYSNELFNLPSFQSSRIEALRFMAVIARVFFQPETKRAYDLRRAARLGRLGEIQLTREAAPLVERLLQEEYGEIRRRLEEATRIWLGGFERLAEMGRLMALAEEVRRSAF